MSLVSLTILTLARSHQTEALTIPAQEDELRPHKQPPKDHPHTYPPSRPGIGHSSWSSVTFGTSREGEGRGLTWTQ